MRRYILHCLPVFLFLILSSTQLNAQADKFIKNTFDVSDRTIPYQIFIPENYSDTMDYPLILSLHGSGDRGSDNNHVSRMPEALVWSYPDVQSKNPCFVLVPQCPYGSHWWNHSFDVYDLLDYIISEYSIDLHRIYVTGTSLGAEGSWFMSQRAPYRFAAVVPSAGGGIWHALKILPYFPAYWIFHGRNDSVIPIESARRMVRELEKLGNNFIFTHCDWTDCSGMTESEFDSVLQYSPQFIFSEFKNASNGIDDLNYNNPNLKKWIFKQSNDLLPIKNPITPLTSVIDNTHRDFTYNYPASVPVLKKGGTGSYDAGGLRSPVIIREGDTLKMWYSADKDLGSGVSAVSYAWSLDCINWTKYANNPVLIPKFEWEGTTIHEIALIKDENLYKIWYGVNSYPGFFTNSVGYATSPDGINWTKHSQPVLLPGESGDWDFYNIHPGTIIKEDNLYKMWYSAGNFVGHFQIGYAESSDGINWTKYNNQETNENPYINSDPVVCYGTSGIDRAALFKPSVHKTESGYEMYYIGTDLYLESICYAISEDGISWQKYYDNPIVYETPSWTESREFWDVFALKYNDITQLWFSVPQMVNGGDYTAYSEVGFLNIPGDAPHCISINADPICFNNLMDTILITAGIENPRKNNLEVLAIMSDDDHSIIDSLR